MIAVRIDAKGVVDARCSMEVALAASEVWGQMRDWRRFLALDPLHQRVRVVNGPSDVSPQGTELIIPHRMLMIGPDRVGRILTWKEGSGYAISDLSRRGARAGFPHVCQYQVRSAGPGSCVLTVSARGLWTARWVPVWARRLWLWWVLRATEGMIVGELVTYARWRKRHRNHAKRPML